MNDEDKLNPIEWGWGIQNHSLLPQRLDKSSTPQHLINVIRCTCKIDCDIKNVLVVITEYVPNVREKSVSILKSLET